MIKINFADRKKTAQIKDKNTAVVEIQGRTFEGPQGPTLDFKDSEVVKKPSGQKIISVGLGSPKDFNLRKLHLLPRQIVSLAKQNKIKKLAITSDEFRFEKLGLDDYQLGRILATEFEMANFEFVRFKTAPKEGWNFVTQITLAGNVTEEFKKGTRDGQLVGEEVNQCRVLANTPGGEMTPKLLAQAARQAARGTKIKVKVLGRREMQKLGMGAVLGVAAGSDEEPQFIIMEYWGDPKGRTFKGSQGPTLDSRPVVLVGKGVTFDTGGLNLKPEQGIYEMHMDMSGGAAVISSIVAAAKLGVKKNIVGLVPAVENMPSGSSYRPGDILKTMSGKTIEVLNTDAEGRIILADGLFYAGRYKPCLVIDVATLTSSAVHAFGLRASAIFTKDFNLSKLLIELSETSGDYVWPMPLWDEYEDEIRGTFGDWANIGKSGAGRWGGVINAAVFLQQFTLTYPRGTSWLHIDMAPRMTAVDGEFLAKGAAGAPVRLLVSLLDKY